MSGYDRNQRFTRRSIQRLRSYVPVAFLLLVLGVVVGCAGGQPIPLTPMQELATWEARMTAARLDVESALRDDAITPDQAEDATTALDTADAALITALAVIQGGGTLESTQTQLTVAREVLLQLGALLGKVYIDGSTSSALDPPRDWSNQFATRADRDGAEGFWTIGRGGGGRDRQGERGPVGLAPAHA